MKDITLDIEQYKVCTRHLWNCFFRNKVNRNLRSKILTSYEEIDKLLFSSFVLDQLTESIFEGTIFEDPIPFVKVVLNPPNTRIPILVQRKDAKGYWDDPINFATRDSIELNFVRLYDWDMYGSLDLRYYMAKIDKFVGHPDYTGRFILVETQYSKIFYKKVKDEEK